MADLYKGIAGSPITYLAADISANQTTISIADDSALPDAPNICTIGYGENLETIKYETKSNGVLQNVTRGIEGTPRAWPAGTEVARFFTAYDHNSIIENFNSHLAESANKHIHSNGSNDDGYWIKYDDGTQICYQRGITEISGLSIAPGETYIGDSIPHAMPFVGARPFGKVNGYMTDSTGNRFKYLITSYANANAMVAPQYHNLSDSRTCTRIIYVSTFVIGRWR